MIITDSRAVLSALDRLLGQAIKNAAVRGDAGLELVSQHSTHGRAPADRFHLDIDLSGIVWFSARRSPRAYRVGMTTWAVGRSVEVDLGPCREWIWSLTHDLGRALAEDGDWLSALHGARRRVQQRLAAEDVPVGVAWVARRATEWSVRVLPVVERGRYREEFSAELYGLRDEPWRRQVGYAVRLFVRSVGLRRSLRSATAPARARDW